MKPIVFKESNTTLTKPNAMSDEQCKSLPVFGDDQQTISCWKLNFTDRLKALFYGRLWLSVLWGGGTQPPVCLQCDKPVFKKSTEK